MPPAERTKQNRNPKPKVSDQEISERRSGESNSNREATNKGIP
jgi:hypothetical protein